MSYLYNDKKKWNYTHNQAECVRQFRQFLIDQQGTIFVTLAINQGVRSLDWMKGRLSECVANTERGLHGGRFYNLPPDKRLRGFFFPEKMDVNSHWHGIMRLPASWADSRAECVTLAHTFSDCWKSTVKSGTAEIKEVTDDLVAGISYITKEHWRNDFWDRYIMLEDFWPASRTGRKR